MAESEIHLYYKNVTAEVIGDEHGITKKQFADIAAQTQPAIAEVNRQREQGKTPFRDLPLTDEYRTNVERIAAEFQDDCETLVVLGIGGSALGNIAVQTALNPYMYNLDASQRKNSKCPRLFVFDNVDPSQFGSFLNSIEDRLDKTVFNVISKSGLTAETASQFLVIRQMLLDKLGTNALKDRMIATTDAKEGTMRKIADASGIRTLVVPDGVGGRFSVLSPVGLLSAAMCGIDIEQLLKGAADMDQRVSQTKFDKNPAAINAGVNWHYYNRGKPISVMMPYSYALKDFADWYRQLWAESLGKSNDLSGGKVYVGPTP
ncbi:MAG: glucose-6-phosphate isomerase, partial [Planctomycetes bacterium]|nr:glucose-6-phosphate isomerase [Planctomycetota bacterium]